ncbi:hypothetical protein, partial [Flavobacterium bizetiae]|uniref:hypothetical protein n=1 Tax=Flavobacterium bizetiae TaxID=2704140 RepID=UPI001E619D4B
AGAISRYPLQSFVLNPGTKGFPLLSGLGEQLSKQTFEIKEKKKTSKKSKLSAFASLRETQTTNKTQLCVLLRLV